MPRDDLRLTATRYERQRRQGTSHTPSEASRPGFPSRGRHHFDL